MTARADKVLLTNKGMPTVSGETGLHLNEALHQHDVLLNIPALNSLHLLGKEINVCFLVRNC